MDRSFVQIALLQALVPSDGYGLELIERVRVTTVDRILLHQGTIYPALRTLERNGLVVGYDGESPAVTGGRPRRYYKLTSAGQRAAVEHARALAALISPALRWSAEGARR